MSKVKGLLSQWEKKSEEVNAPPKKPVEPSKTTPTTEPKTTAPTSTSNTQQPVSKPTISSVIHPPVMKKEAGVPQPRAGVPLSDKSVQQTPKSGSGVLTTTSTAKTTQPVQPPPSEKSTQVPVKDAGVVTKKEEPKKTPPPKELPDVLKPEFLSKLNSYVTQIEKQVDRLESLAK